MEFSELILESVRTLTINKLRTALAALGVVIGIGSVIALISLGQGSQKAIENQIQSLGSNLLTVIPGGIQQGGVRGAAGGGTTLTLDDAIAIQKSQTLTNIKNVSPEFSRRTQVVAGANNTNTQITGVYPQYADIRKVSINSGRFIHDTDIPSFAKVAVLGPTTSTTLFGEGVDPVGQTVRINGQMFSVIGLTEAKGGTGFNNPDDAIYVPLSTAQKILFGVTNVSTISVEAVSADTMTDVQNQIGYFLLERHKLSSPADADFQIFSQNDILNTASQVTGTFTTLLGGIAAISLLVGGIGIMNIMLVNVTERTREIGLRKALGAKNKLITTQFLIESILLTTFGGIVGMLLGIFVSYMLSKVMNIPFAVSVSSILVSVLVSGTIGVIFGWYPAKRASKLEPIEALRYE